jgi:hypothetical protein
MKKQKDNRRQHNRGQKAAKRKAVVVARKAGQAMAPLSPLHRARAAASAYDISYCMMTEGIFGIGMGSVILGREYSSAKTAISHFLLDVHCLGVKDAHYSELTHEQLREMLDEYESHVDIAPECARKLVQGAVAYGKEYGFLPHADYLSASALFGDIDAATCPTEYEFGRDGKPFYVSGPNDTPARIKKILRTLTKNAGEGNFEFMAGMGAL